MFSGRRVTHVDGVGVTLSLDVSPCAGELCKTIKKHNKNDRASMVAASVFATILKPEIRVVLATHDLRCIGRNTEARCL